MDFTSSAGVYGVSSSSVGFAGFAGFLRAPHIMSMKVSFVPVWLKNLYRLVYLSIYIYI